VPLIVQSALGLLIATVLGGAIGFQRQYLRKPAGLRTHALVSLGSCAFAEYSALLGDTRIAAGVITGVGFLGAGAIVRHGFTTRGLTTAASIWAAAAIGMGVGLGREPWAILSLTLTALTLAVLTISDEALMRYLPHASHSIRVVADLDQLSVGGLGAAIAKFAARVHPTDEVLLDRSTDSHRAVVGYIVQLRSRESLVAFFENLLTVDGVLRVEVSDEPVSPAS
jgi:putative Mg2+ transporter-C (MgtC) family protein